MDLINRSEAMVASVAQRMASHLASQVTRINAGSLADASFSLESMDSTQRKHVMEVDGEFTHALESMCSELFPSKSLSDMFTKSQMEAAKQGGMMALAMGKYRNRTLRQPQAAGATPDNTFAMESMVSDAVTERSYAAEAYDERDNRSAVAFTVTYNLQSSRQDDFGEALYPTIAIPADQAGIVITTSLLYVMDNVDRNVSGAAYDLKRKNVLRAVADPTVLRKDQTRVYPVNRGQSATKFVDTAVVPSINVDVEGSTVVTGPLKFGIEVGLLDISQSDAMIAAGSQNQTDTLDPALEITDVYYSFSSGANVIKFRTEGLPFFNFVPQAQEDYKALQLSAETKSILLNADTREVDGTALDGALAQIAADDLSVRVRLVLSGRARTDTGNVAVYANAFEVFSITAADGSSIALNDGSVAALVAALNGGTALGYLQKSYRANQNRRQQGQFVDVAKKFQRYTVPLRSPISTRHPAHVDGSIDASDVQALITTTRIRLANEAVSTVLNTIDTLTAYSDIRDNVNEGPDVLGIGRDFVRPYFIKRTWDAALSIDSLKSHERARDIQAALINQVRDITYELYRGSEYKAAADAIYGGQGPIPTVILATDPYTARYLTVEGDLRTLGGEFQVKVVVTLDVRFRNKIAIAFAVEDAERNSSVNPLNNGNLLWAPELVLTANIGRQGQFSRETLVQPRYLFVQNLPVLGLLEVSNIPSTIGRIPLQMTDVTAP